MKRLLTMTAATVLTVGGCAYTDSACYDGCGGPYEPFYDGAAFDGAVYGGGDAPVYLPDGVEYPTYLPDGAVIGPQMILPGGETIPAPAGEPLPEPAQ